MKDTVRQLVRVPPNLIRIAETWLAPTARDRACLQHDLDRYVRRARFIAACPAAALRDGEVFAVNGIPFIRAAQRANPPLDRIVCQIDATEEQIRRIGLQITSPSAELAHAASTPPGQAINILVFDKSVSDRRRIDAELRSLQMESARTVDHSNADTERTPKWTDDDTAVEWYWGMLDPDPRSLGLVLKKLRHIHEQCASIRSWNGLGWNYLSRRD